MFQINVHPFAIMSQPKKIQRSGEKVPKIKVLQSSQDKNIYKVIGYWQQVKLELIINKHFDV